MSAQNWDDLRSHQRTPATDRPDCRKLTMGQARELRHLYETTNTPLSYLCETYGITNGAAHAIISGRTYRENPKPRTITVTPRFTGRADTKHRVYPPLLPGETAHEWAARVVTEIDGEMRRRAVERG